MVTSLELRPIRCAIMLCHFGQTRNGYVATYFFHISSTAASSATSGYVVVPQHFGQSEKPASRKKERAREKPSFVPSSGFYGCNIKTHVNMNFTHHFFELYVLDFIYSRCIF